MLPRFFLTLILTACTLPAMASAGSGEYSCLAWMDAQKAKTGQQPKWMAETGERMVAFVDGYVAAKLNITGVEYNKFVSSVDYEKMINFYCNSVGDGGTQDMAKSILEQIKQNRRK